jgi:PTH1 family peptidyl-tRNA hydrolase
MHIGVGMLHGQHVALVRPKTYVNHSGRAVAQALQWTGCDLAHSIVAYDDLDLPPGQLRIRAGGGHGGHNGLKSIAQHAGLEFIRVRIGIGRPVVGGEPSWDPEIVADWVLSPPSPAERELLEAAVQRAADAIEVIVTDGVEAAAATYNRKA